MARYSLDFSQTAKKQLLSQPRDAQVRLLRAINQLTDEPRPRGCRKLHGSIDTFRIRVGYYRVVYEIEGNQMVVLVVKLGHRKDIYR